MKKTRQKKTGAFRKAQVFMIVGTIMATVFLPSSALLGVGMMPTFVAILIDSTKKASRAFTVGAMNLAGCSPFLLTLWAGGHSLDRSLQIISDPKAVVIMYAAAAAGYTIDWTLTEIVSGILYQRGRARQNAIAVRQKELVERWGREVTGALPLDQDGFPLKTAADSLEPPKDKKERQI